MSKSVPQLTEKTDQEADDFFHINRAGVDYKQKRSTILPLYKVYRAIVTQAGTSAPTVVVLENSIGAIVWSRTGVGTYEATLAGAFTLNKTFLSRGDNYSGFSNVGFWVDDVNKCYMSSQNNDGTNAGGAYADALIDGMPIQILVYP